MAGKHPILHPRPGNRVVRFQHAAGVAFAGLLRVLLKSWSVMVMGMLLDRPDSMGCKLPTLVVPEACLHENQLVMVLKL